MEIQKNIELNNSMQNETNLEKEQNNFLDSMLGKAINTGVDIGIRALMPDLIEDQIINIKDNLIEYGLKDGISKTIEEAIDFGKSAIGIFTGNFENVSQMQLAVSNGGILDGVSTVLDYVVDKAEQKGAINSTVSSLLRQGKDTILNSIESNIEKSFDNQLESVDDLQNHINSWQKHYNNKDFEKMDVYYNKIQKELSNLAPLESSLSQARTIENIHNLIKSNGQNFNLNETELELLKKLS